MWVSTNDSTERQRKDAGFLGFLVTALLVVAAVFVAFSLYERFVLGEYSLAINELPYVTPYYSARLVAAFLLSLLTVYGLYSLRADGAAIEARRLSSGQTRVVGALIVLGIVFAVLLLGDPVLFYEIGLEDNIVEWVSALTLLAASGLFVWALAPVWQSHQRGARRSVALAFIPLFAFFLFFSCMEEISWMQRVFDIATPAMFEGNQQREMNLHNMHSIIIGSAYKLLVFGGLIILPFIADMAPRSRLFDLVEDFIPSRLVLAASAPLAAFHYNEWNFFATPLIVFVTLFILACYIKAAWDRHDGREMVLFGAVMTFITVVQPVFLARGHTMVRMWDAGEYMELFMAIGLALFAWETATRLRARYRGRVPVSVAPADYGEIRETRPARAYYSRRAS